MLSGASCRIRTDALRFTKPLKLYLFGAPPLVSCLDEEKSAATAFFELSFLSIMLDQHFDQEFTTCHWGRAPQPKEKK
jgi:hypothetical protein